MFRSLHTAILILLLAAGLAAAGEGTTIYNTAGGMILQGLPQSSPVVQAGWKVGSWFYANTTGGEAIVVLGPLGGTATTALGGIEAPVLAARGVQVLTW